MPYLEIIQIRLIKGINDKTVENICKSTIKEHDTISLQLFKNCTISTDTTIHLFHEHKIKNQTPSQLCLLLISMLKEYGMVEHSLWVQKL